MTCLQANEKGVNGRQRILRTAVSREGFLGSLLWISLCVNKEREGLAGGFGFVKQKLK